MGADLTLKFRLLADGDAMFKTREPNEITNEARVCVESDLI